MRSRYRNGIRYRCSVVSVRTPERNCPLQCDLVDQTEEETVPRFAAQTMFCFISRENEQGRSCRLIFVSGSSAKISDESSVEMLPFALEKQGRVQVVRCDFLEVGSLGGHMSLIRILCVNWFPFSRPLIVVIETRNVSASRLYRSNESIEKSSLMKSMRERKRKESCATHCASFYLQSTPKQLRMMLMRISWACWLRLNQRRILTLIEIKRTRIPFSIRMNLNTFSGVSGLLTELVPNDATGCRFS